MRLRLCFLLLVSLVLAADEPFDYLVEADLRKLEGAWIVQTTEWESPHSRNAGKGTICVVAGERLTIYGPDGTRVECRIRIDPVKKPSVMEIQVLDPSSSLRPEEDMPSVRSTYELSGDTLTIGTAAAAASRRLALQVARLEAAPASIVLYRQRR